MGYASEDYDYEDAMACYSDCSHCEDKTKELEECYDGYDLFRSELEKIDNVYTEWYHSAESNSSDKALLKIYEHLINLFKESGYETNVKFLKAVI
jgi:hypothetical protein